MFLVGGVGKGIMLRQRCLQEKRTGQLSCVGSTPEAWSMELRVLGARFGNLGSEQGSEP